MKIKNLNLCLLYLLVTGAAYSQNIYTYSYTLGSSNYDYNYTTASIILQTPASEIISAVQHLPFDWYFYGEKVIAYRASENGYITFDTTDNSGVSNNTTIPNNLKPNKAIYVCWDNWECSSTFWLGDKVQAITIGTAPNRIHIIQWVHMTQGTNDPTKNWGFFGMRIFENGDFDIIHSGFNGPTTLNASVTVGVENKNGDTATMVMGPMDILQTFTGYNDPADDRVYSFKWELPKHFDIKPVKLLGLRETYPINKKYNFSISISNESPVTTVTSFEIVYTINGGPDKTYLVDNISLLPYKADTFKVAIPDSFANVAQFYNLTMTTGKVNGMTDENTGNNAILNEKVYSVNGNSAKKYVLLEENTGTWCQHCIKGIDQIDTIEHYFGEDAICVSMHGNDVMENATGKSIINTFKMAYPNGLIDRYLYEDQSTVNMLASLVTNTWVYKVQERLIYWSPVKVYIVKNYDSINRRLDVTIKANFTDYAIPGDLRFMLYLVENDIYHPGDSDYYQANALSGAEYYKGTYYYYQPDPIPDFTHNHVLREVPSGAWGHSGIIGTNPEPGDSFTESFDAINIKSDWNDRKMKIIGFVYYYNTDIQKREVLNSCRIRLSGIGTDYLNEQVNKNQTVIYPVPARDFIMIRNVNSKVTILNITGSEVWNGKVNGYKIVDISSFKTGVYIVKMDEYYWKIIKQ